MEVHVVELGTRRKSMSQKIPETYMDLFEKKAIAALATLMADGSPQVTPVWVTYEAPFVVVNSAKGRVKDQNMRRDPRVALEIRDPDNPYRYLGIQGEVVEITEVGARDMINRLSQKYVGEATYQGPPDEVRVTYMIRPDTVWGNG
jgi:PPOX class probable F420-dependent enzyme